MENLWCDKCIQDEGLGDSVSLLVLPVHAPDLNPIEMWWATIKREVAAKFSPRRTLNEVEKQF